MMKLNLRRLGRRRNGVTKELLYDDLRTLVKDAEGFLSSRWRPQEKPSDLPRQRLATTLANTRHVLSELETQTRQGLKASGEVIRNHPYSTLGIVVGTGLLVTAIAAKGWRE